MARPHPSLSGAQWATVREQVDTRFLDLVRSLEDSYYGTALTWDADGSARTRSLDGWRHGVSHPFVSGAKVYDVQLTNELLNIEETKTLFDKLHGLIWQHHTVAMVDQNIADGKPYALMDDETVEQEISRKPGQAPDEERSRVTKLSRKNEAEKRIDDLQRAGLEIDIT